MTGTLRRRDRLDEQVVVVDLALDALGVALDEYRSLHITFATDWQARKAAIFVTTLTKSTKSETPVLQTKDLSTRLRSDLPFSTERLRKLG